MVSAFSYAVAWEGRCAQHREARELDVLVVGEAVGRGPGGERGAIGDSEAVPIAEVKVVAAVGVVDPTPAQVFDPQNERIIETQPLWRYPIMAAVGVMLLDLLLRRVRMFDRKFKRGWAK